MLADVLRTADVELTPVQQMVLDRMDAAVAIGAVALAVVVALLAVIAIRALWS